MKKKYNNITYEMSSVFPGGRILKMTLKGELITMGGGGGGGEKI